MNARRFIVCFALALAAFAVATVITTDTATGEGKAVNHDGQFAEFVFAAGKVTHNDHTEKHGTFRFVMRTGDHAEARLTLRSLATFNVTENVATFGGPGTLRVQTGGQAHEYEGTIAVIASSNRHRGEVGEPDRIVVRFVPAVQSNPDLSFEGNLTTGDIAVTTTKSY
jgi:hypothetical protein